jgi:hypothetical protein
MVQKSSEKCQLNQLKSLSNSLSLFCKSANAFKSATKREEICTIFDPLFISTRDKNLINW